ncbi:MAG: hypothetical protein DMG76_00555 [Acidobacteria bacterium]|nr:MAG: hypothetical protein DMG76_00555 [Acidobacteriota bacterium]
MKLRFPGTRGDIDIKNRSHRRHSCLLVEESVLVDCGADWLGRFGSPKAIMLTHAHPDHIGGLKRGAHCPVYATQETWARMKRYPIHDRQVVAPFQSFSQQAAVVDLQRNGAREPRQRGILLRARSSATAQEAGDHSRPK